MTVAASSAAAATLALVVVHLITVVEGLCEPATAAERNPSAIVIRIVTNSGGINLGGIFDGSFRLLSSGFLAGFGSGSGCRSLSLCLLVTWARWMGRRGLGNRALILGEEWMIFDARHEIPEGIRGRVQIIDWRHSARLFPITCK